MGSQCVSGAELALRNAMMKAVYLQGTYIIGRNITMINEVALQIPVAGCDPGKDSVLYTDNHHTVRTSKPWYSSFLKSKNCLVFFFFIQMPFPSPPSLQFQICQPFHWHFRQLLFLHFRAINM